MSITYVDLPPLEALRQAREAVSQGTAEAWDALDRHFRWLLVAHLQNRSQDANALEEALIEASYWAEREDQIPWCHTWPYLLELLTDAEAQPSLAEDLAVVSPVEGRAAELLALLVHHPNPLRPIDLSEKLGMSQQQVSNLAQKLEKAGLIVRRRTGGKAAWIFPTPRGFALAARLPRMPEMPQSPATSGDRFWNRQALDQQVRVA